jgi:hypothetical protein
MAPWKYTLIAGAKLIGLIILSLVYLRLLFSPTWSSMVLWGTILIGCAWFVWILLSRWYPTLREKFGLPRIYKVLIGLNALAWLPGFWVARYALNSITGVDAGNFPTALWAFTLGGIVYVWLILMILCLGLTAFKSMSMFFILWVWEEIRRFFLDLVTLSIHPQRLTRTGRHLRDTCAFMCVIFLLGMVGENTTMRHAVKSFATIVLVLTEFSYDHTCTASSETRWVAPLKDRKEMKVSNILIADVQSLTHIQLTIGHCE